MGPRFTAGDMRCGSCGWDNPAGIIFCTNCGKRGLDEAAAEPARAPSGPLQERARPPTMAYRVGQAEIARPAPAGAACQRCGAASAPGLRFCRECGAPIEGAAPPPAASPAPAIDYGHPAQDAGGFGAPAPVQVRTFTPPSPATPQPFAPPAPAPAAYASPAASVARLVMLLRDGSEGRTIPLNEGDADIGSREGEIIFGDDPYLSPRHARVSCRAGAYTLRDLDSANGVYVRLRDVQDLHDRDMILLGQQVLRFELLLDGELPLGPAWQGGVLVFGTPEVSRFARLVQYTTEGVGRDVHYLFRDETVIGRENGDIVFTDDPFLSRRHAAIRIDHAGHRFTLHDLGSSNGTALRIRGEHVLRDGDQFRIGRHLFRFENTLAGGPARFDAAGSVGGRSER
ncbi:MAG: FHA domain-containing protein [Myxococcales bacterium]